MRRLADEHGLAVITVADLVANTAGGVRRRRRRRRAAGASPRAPAGASGSPRPSCRPGTGGFTAIGYRDRLTGDEHVALVSGMPVDGPLVRVHSECLTGDAFGSHAL